MQKNKTPRHCDRSASGGASCCGKHHTKVASETQPPKLHPMGRTALDRLRYELMERGNEDLTTKSAIDACAFLLRNF